MMMHGLANPKLSGL